MWEHMNAQNVGQTQPCDKQRDIALKRKCDNKMMSAWTI